MNRQLKNILIALISLAAVVVVFSFFMAEDDPVFTESGSSNYSLTSYQQKTGANNSINESRRNIITETVKNVSPAVVGINVIEIREVQYNNPFGNFFDDPFFRQYFGSRTRRQQVKGLGSGFLISADGYILTNDHVAGNASEITVTMTNGKHYNAKIIGSDPVSDICLLKIDDSKLPYIPLGNSDDIIVGEWVIALGNPFGLFELNEKPTVTVGVISASGMNLEPLNDRYYLSMLQTDAAINGGNSGGPLVNSLGEVIGMNTLIFTSGTSQGSIGLGFAIPINKVKRIVTELKEKGRIDRSFNIGMRIQSVDEGIAEYYDLDVIKGVIVTKVLRGSPADKAGIEPGDIITQVENYKIDNENTLIGVFQEFRKGQTIDIKLLREKSSVTTKMKLEE
jgi:serine protease Do